MQQVILARGVGFGKILAELKICAMQELNFLQLLRNKSMASITKRGLYWRVQIKRKGHLPIYRTFNKKLDATTFARSIENDMDRGIYFDRTESESTTLLDALDRYEREVIEKKQYPQQELQRVKHWRKQPLSNKYLANLRASDFAKYRDERLGAGRATATVRQELQVVSHLFETARKEWGMEGLLNPLKNIRKPAGSKERDRRLQEGEYEAIKASLAACGNQYAWPAFELAIETALRQGMLFKLRWDWVDLSTRVIRIPIEYRQAANKGVPAGVPLSTQAVNVLQSMPQAASGRIFDCTANAVSTIWKRRMKELGIEGLRWHDLRHESASRMSEKGMHPLQIAACTGHKSLNMLRRYTHLKPEDLAAMLG